MNIVLYIALFSAMINLSIGTYLFSKSPRNKINGYFFLFVLSIVAFNISEFLIRISITGEESLFWGRIGYNVMILGPCFALSFSFIFPRKIIPKRYDLMSKYLIISVYVMALIIYFLFIISTSIQDVKYSEWGYRLPVTSSSFFVVIWFLVIGGSAIFCLAYKYFWGDFSNIEQNQIKFILTGGILMVIMAIGTNVIPLFVYYHIYPTTSLFTSIFVIFVGYAITKYKFLSLSKEMIAENIFSIMNDLVIIVNEKEEVVNVNNSTLKLLGYEKKELVNSSLKQIIRMPEPDKRDIKKVFKSLEGVHTNKMLKDIEVEFENKSGKTIPMSVSASPIYDKNKNLEGIVLVARDLSEIKKSLKEKELLLREIHHRVKNNLQTISSLLDLQSEQIKNKKISEMFEESQNRIKLMATLHEYLYQSKNLIKINFGDFIQNFITNLIYSYRINPDTINPKIIIEEISMDIDKTLICSFIINELVSNSLKHAFPAGREGEIIVEFRLKNNTYRMIVGDTGVGLPKEVNFRNTKTLGLQLVYLFVQQLKGNIKIDRTGGTKFIITFKNVKEGRRRKTYGKKADSSC